MTHYEGVLAEPQPCVACEAVPGVILIRVRDDVDVSICATCWKLIRDERSGLRPPTSRFSAGRLASRE
jgi:hypothetical protein